ncbi:MAG: 50S ribosomal protein L3 [Clostridia bacterium]|nr:50S ribosomal protein L3 [Clostridia bacterium]
MKKSILATKLGMTQVYAADGTVVPVTVLQAGPCYVVQKKTVENDGYNAVQLGFGKIRASLVNKPKAGAFKKAGLEPMRYLREFKLEDAQSYEVGQEIKCDIFAAGDKVDATATSKGKGFQGVIKRHNQARGRMTHGSGFHRAPGSMGGASDPSRVMKSKNLPGHMGFERVTVQNLTVFSADAEKNVILVRGSVPGPNGALVCLVDSVKH